MVAGSDLVGSSPHMWEAQHARKQPAQLLRTSEFIYVHSLSSCAGHGAVTFLHAGHGLHIAYSELALQLRTQSTAQGQHTESPLGVGAKP